MPSRIKIGFGATFTSSASDKMLEVLQMRGITLPPLVLDIAFYGLLLLLVFGLVMLFWGIIEWISRTRKQKQIIAEQSEDIANLESSLASLRRECGNRYLVELPSLLTQLHRHLRATVGVMRGQRPDDEVLFGVIESWTAKTEVGWI